MDAAGTWGRGKYRNRMYTKDIERGCGWSRDMGGGGDTLVAWPGGVGQHHTTTSANDKPVYNNTVCAPF